jgi:hypothetical protein
MEPQAVLIPRTGLDADVNCNQLLATKASGSQSDEADPEQVEIPVTSKVTVLASDVQVHDLSTMFQQNLAIKDSTKVSGRNQKPSLQRNPGCPKPTWRIVKPAESRDRVQTDGNGKRKRDLHSDCDGEAKQIGSALKKKPRISHPTSNESRKGDEDDRDLAVSSLETSLKRLNVTPKTMTIHWIQDAGEPPQFNYRNDAPGIPIPTHLDVVELVRLVAKAQKDFRNAQNRRSYAERRANRDARRKASDSAGEVDETAFRAVDLEECPKLRYAQREEAHYRSRLWELRSQVPERCRQYEEWVREQWRQFAQLEGRVA